MTNAMQVLKFNENEIRMTELGDEPWWVAKDICDVLNIEKHRDAISRLDDDERGSVVVDTLGGPQSMAAVNEAGLFQLILTSRKPEAKAFKRFVCHEMLPQWRKRGFYIDKAATQRTRELASLEFRAEAERARIEAEAWELKARQVFEIEGAVPLMDWIITNRPELNTKQAANLSRTLKQVITKELDRPVSNMSVPRKGKRLCARPEDIAAAVDVLNNRKQLEAA
jgi:prophage antirepressor-like protein